MDFPLEKGVPPQEWQEVRVGNVYGLANNQRDRTGIRLKVVVAVMGEKFIFLTIDLDGKITSCGQGKVSVMQRNIPVGKVAGLGALQFPVTRHDEAGQ